MTPAYHSGYVVDTSVAVAWYVEEEQSRAAGFLLDRFRRNRCGFAGPGWLFFLEVGNAPWKKGFEESAVAEVLGNLWRYRFTRVEIRWDLVRKPTPSRGVLRLPFMIQRMGRSPRRRVFPW